MCACFTGARLSDADPAQVGGAELNILPQSMCDRVFQQVSKGYSQMGERDWPPLLRLLDNEDSSYRN